MTGVQDGYYYESMTNTYRWMGPLLIDTVIATLIDTVTLNVTGTATIITLLVTTLIVTTLTSDTLYVDFIVGKTTASTLSLLGKTITTTIMGYVETMNQGVRTTDSPTFASITSTSVITAADVTADSLVMTTGVGDIYTALLYVNTITGRTLSTSLSLLGSTITSTIMGYVAAMNQNVATTSNVTHATITATNYMICAGINTASEAGGPFYNFNQAVQTTSSPSFTAVTLSSGTAFNTYLEATHNSALWGGVWSTDGAIKGTTVAKDFKLVKIGKAVTLFLPAFQVAPGSVPFSDYIYLKVALPSAYRPTTTQQFITKIINNNAYTFGTMIVQSDGIIYWWAGHTFTYFSNANSAGIPDESVTWYA